MAWRLAKSLKVALDEVNKAVPQRDKSSDGTIGDATHASRTSDHNPDKDGVVKALDITNDPGDGVVSRDICEDLRARQEPRVRYCISNRQIFYSPESAKANNVKPWTWSKYTGSNPHTLHGHISVSRKPALYDDTSTWKLKIGKPLPGDKKEPMPKLRRGSKGMAVQLLQTRLKMTEIDGQFGPKTEKAVKAFQKSHKIVADGIVGPYTWEKLLLTNTL